MTTAIEFDRTRAKVFVQDWDLWPMTERAENTLAQEWWLSVLERVLWSVNERDWNDEAYPEDQYTEITESAVGQWVEQARKSKIVMTICELSEVHKAITDPFDDGIYTRLTSTLMEVTGTENVHRYGGEDETEYEERLARARRQHHENCAKLLTLDSVTEIYLTAAADDVARAWCAALVEDWQEANPEDDEDEDEDEE